MADVNAKSLNDVLGGAECYLGNLSELAGELQEVLVTEEGNIIKIDSYQKVIAILQVLWDKFKEVAKECEDKDINVDLGDDLKGTITRTVLSVLGFNL